MSQSIKSVIERAFIVVLPGGEAAIYDRALVASIEHGSAREDIPLTAAHPQATRIDHLSLIGLARSRAVILPSAEAFDDLDERGIEQLRVMHGDGVPMLTLSEHAGRLAKVLGVSLPVVKVLEGSRVLVASRGDARGKYRHACLTLADEAAVHFPFNAYVETLLDDLRSDAAANVPYPTVSVADDSPAPRGPWQSAAPDFIFRYTGKGGTAQVWMNGYQLNPLPDHPTHKQYNYFLLVMQVAQGNVNYKENCGEVGYYCQNEIVVLRPVAGQDIYEYGPNSTIGEASVSFSVGASLQGGVEGGKPGGSAGVSAEWGVSYSAPDTTFTVTPVYPQNSKDCSSVKYFVRLPGVGFQSPGIPANPKFASKGYQWTGAAVIRVPKAGEGQDPIPAEGVVTVDINWDRDKPRGIASAKDRWQQELPFSFPPGA